MMLADKKKTVLIITLAVSALLIDVIMLLDYILFKYKAFSSYGRLLYEFRLFHWGWFLVLSFTGFAIAGTLYWKPGRVLFRGIVIFLSVVAIILALLWLFGLIMISTLKF
jgi:hypothetical protein